MFRKLIFWSHLTAGVFVALFVAFMAVTGAALAYQPQIVRYFERRLLANAGAHLSACMSPGQLLFAVQRQTSKPVGTVQIFSDASLPAQVQFGKEEVLFVDPCTGRLLSGSATAVRSFLLTVRNLHESVALGHEREGVLRDIKNAANLGFCFLILSGVVLWVPRRWRKANFRAVTVFRTDLQGRPRDWNWHNVTGFWLALPLLVISLTGVIMSYSWAEDLLYRASGSPPPAARGSKSGIDEDRTKHGLQSSERTMAETSPGVERHKPENANREPGEEKEHERDPQTTNPKREARDFDGHPSVEHVRGRGEQRGLQKPLTAAEFLTLDPLLEQAKQQVPDWQNIRLQVQGASAETVAFMFDDGDESDRKGKGQRSELRMNRLSGRILQWTAPSQASRGQSWRSYTRVLHTGEVFGFPGQTVALLAALGATLLVWTGIALSLRRFVAWRVRNARLRTDFLLSRMPQDRHTA